MVRRSFLSSLIGVATGWCGLAPKQEPPITMSVSTMDEKEWVDLLHTSEHGLSGVLQFVHHVTVHEKKLTFHILRAVITNGKITGFLEDDDD